MVRRDLSLCSLSGNTARVRLTLQLCAGEIERAAVIRRGPLGFFFVRPSLVRQRLSSLSCVGP